MRPALAATLRKSTLIVRRREQQQARRGEQFHCLAVFSPSFLRNSVNSPSGGLVQFVEHRLLALRVFHPAGVAIGHHEAVVRRFAGGLQLDGALEQRNRFGILLRIGPGFGQRHQSLGEIPD